MCLITFRYGQHKRYKLILAANRDESYNRPTVGADYWPEYPSLLAGKDLEANGTWFGITKQGKVAAITNCHGEEFTEPEKNKQSRGQILIDYLSKNQDPVKFIKQLIATKDDYQPFNVLLGSVDILYHYNSKDNHYTKLDAGTHSLSNATLNTPWPKVNNTRQQLDIIIQTDHDYIQDLFTMMMDQTPAPDSELPEAPLPLEIRRKASANFIKTEHFGTKSTTLLLVDWHNNVTYIERNYLSEGNHEDRIFNFQITKKSN
ncbi:NRDE family protein [Jeotgalibaca sp. A127]|uniref:NRDE family protein n=1 Tax=Jeotgalibaca sp. A127 TaxID=3457324 RepID=UPI003FD67A1F